MTELFCKNLRKTWPLDIEQVSKHASALTQCLDRKTSIVYDHGIFCKNALLLGLLLGLLVATWLQTKCPILFPCAIYFCFFGEWLLYTLVYLISFPWVISCCLFGEWLLYALVHLYLVSTLAVKYSSLNEEHQQIIFIQFLCFFLDKVLREFPLRPDGVWL